MHSSTKIYLGFLATQIACLAMPVYLAASSDGFSAYATGACIAFAVVSVLLDACLISLVRSHRAAMQERRQENLRIEQLDELESEYEHMRVSITAYSHMRHDIRNQAQVVLLLKRNGEDALALEHIDSLTHALEEMEPDF